MICMDFSAASLTGRKQSDKISAPLQCRCVHTPVEAAVVKVISFCFFAANKPVTLFCFPCCRPRSEPGYDRRWGEAEASLHVCLCGCLSASRSHASFMVNSSLRVLQGEMCWMCCWFHPNSLNVNEHCDEAFCRRWTQWNMFQLFCIFSASLSLSRLLLLLRSWTRLRFRGSISGRAAASQSGPPSRWPAGSRAST